MVNKVILVGFIGTDIEVSYMPGGQVVANLRVATSRGWTDRHSGQRKTETEWHDVEVRGNRAKACGEHLGTGSSVYVEGRLKTDVWKDKGSGEERSRVKIVADLVRFLGREKRPVAPSGESEKPPLAAAGPTADVAA